jgi:hypothetical protein
MKLHIVSMLLLCAATVVFAAEQKPWYAKKLMPNETRIVKSTVDPEVVATFQRDQARLRSALTQQGLRDAPQDKASTQAFVLTGMVAQVSNVEVMSAIGRKSGTDEATFSVVLRGEHPDTRSGWSDWNRLSHIVRINSDATKWTQTGFVVETAKTGEEYYRDLYEKDPENDEVKFSYAYTLKMSGKDAEARKIADLIRDEATRKAMYELLAVYVDTEKRNKEADRQGDELMGNEIRRLNDERKKRRIQSNDAPNHPTEPASSNSAAHR